MPGYPSRLVPVGHVEPVPRRIRAVLAGRTVVDTTRAIYFWEPPGFYPQYYIPVEDVEASAVVDEGEAQGIRRLGLRAGDAERPGAGRHHIEPTVTELTGLVRFDWNAFDAWYEEDERVYVHPRSPYVRVDALRSTRQVRVELEGVVLAESSSPVLVFETGLPTRYYLNRSELNLAHLRPSDTVTACPYKGRTSGYWSVRLGDTTYPDLAWTYEFPTKDLLPIAGLVAFYNEKVDLYLDGTPEPRPHTAFS